MRGFDILEDVMYITLLLLSLARWTWGRGSMHAFLIPSLVLVLTWPEPLMQELLAGLMTLILFGPRVWPNVSAGGVEDWWP